MTRVIAPGWHIWLRTPPPGGVLCEFSFGGMRWIGTREELPSFAVIPYAEWRLTGIGREQLGWG